MAEIDGKGPHTYHPNTFGLLYGKTTKTACGRRVLTSRMVAPLETTCQSCQDAVLESMYVAQEMYNAAVDIARSQGFPSIAEAVAAYRDKD